MKKLIFLLIFLTGCRVGPDYQRPCLAIPSSYRFDAKEGSSAAEDTLWWEQFGDPVLVELIGEALLFNDDIHIAAANVEQAWGYLIQTRSDLFPQLGYSATATRERLGGAANPLLAAAINNPFTTYEILSTATWDIDLWGRIRRQIESARADFFATIQARRQVILSVVASVAKAYLELRGFDEQLIIATKTLKTYQEALIYFEKQFAFGQTSKMSVAQAETQVQSAAAVIPEIQQQIILAENALSVLLGRNPGEIPRGKSIIALHMPQVPSAIPSQILYDRPDILQSEEQLISANALIGAARALYFPDISLTGAFGNKSNELKNLFTGPNKTWNYAGSVVGPLFTFGAIRGTVIQSEAQKSAALSNYVLAIKNAFAEVENALASREHLTRQLEAQGKLVSASYEYTVLANLQYKEGYSPYFVVLQAQEQLFPAELQLVQVRVSLLNSLVAIYQALGGGWVTLVEEKTCDGEG